MKKTPPTIHFSPGDVVLVPFPFTNLTQTKHRPALVMSTDEMLAALPDVVIAQITSKEARRRNPGPGDCPLHHSELAGLPMPSTVRLAKLATVSRDIVIAHVGRLSDSDWKAVIRSFRTMYRWD